VTEDHVEVLSTSVVDIKYEVETGVNVREWRPESASQKQPSY
jgi:hypothetical protein